MARETIRQFREWFWKPPRAHGEVEHGRVSIGLAVGFATLGLIGFEGRFDYGAVGNVVILASRLSDAAAPGEILQGFSRPVQAFRVIGG